MPLAARCPYCFTELDATEPEVRCGRCGTPHHRACFLEHGRCVILGCASTVSKAAGEVELRAHLEVTLGPDKHPFLLRGGHQWGEPRWLEANELPVDMGYGRVFADRLELSAPGDFQPGDEVAGGISLQLTRPFQVRGLRLLLRTTRTTGLSVLPTTLVEREAVLRGAPWEGHLKAIGFAVRSLLHLVDDASELVTLPRGVTRWGFRFKLDPLHPVRERDEESVVSELVAYAEIPSAPDYLRSRSLLHVWRGRPSHS